MIDHYNAFISYRHAPLDSKIAEHVQRTLERFHIPDKIRKSTGKKRIERVFRDKDELPTTSDLSETIYGALDDADYLIVICSENTGESMWVKREIEYFLQSHTRDKVLTVLAGGEPEKVIPDILKSEEREVVGEDGEKHKIRVSLEPLSCDYRLPRRKADKEELPRLASALIGCSYDELMNRRRAYRIRRLSLIFALTLSLMLAFGVYMYDSNMKIKRNLEEAMRNRSIYLANESMRLTDEENRYEALHVALASLPSNYPDGPVTAQTVRALSDSTLAYQPYDGFNLEATWNYYTMSSVRAFEISEDGKTLAACDAGGNINIWDTKSHDLKCSIAYYDATISELMFLDDDTLLISDSYNIIAYDIDDGSEKWKYETQRSVTFNSISLTDEGCITFAVYPNNLYKMDITDGSIIGSYELPADTSDMYHLFYAFEASSDADKVAFIISSYADVSDETYQIGVLDLTTGQYALTDPTTDKLSNICWLENGNLCYASIGEYYSLYGYEANGMYFENTGTICTINPDDMSLIWETSIEYTGEGVELDIFELGASGGICCSCGTTSVVYDTETGVQLRDFELNDRLVDASDRDGDGNPIFITESGNLLFPTRLDNGDYISYDEFVDDIIDAKVNDGVYVYQSYSNTIIYYDTFIYDDDIEKTDDPIDYEYVSQSMMGDEILALKVSEGSGYKLAVVDPEDNEFIGEKVFGDDFGASDFTIMGIDGEKIYLGVTFDGFDIIIVDTSNMKTKQVSVSDKYCFINSHATMNGGRICVYERDSNNNFDVIMYDIESGDVTRFSTDYTGVDPLDVPILPAEYLPETNMIFVAFDGYSAFIDVDSEDVIVPDFQSASGDNINVAEDPSGEILFLASKNEIVLLDKEGEQIRSITTNGRDIREMDCYTIGEDICLFVSFSDSTLCRYNIEDMTLQGITDISTYSGGFSGTVTFSYDAEAGYFYVQYGFLTDIIETQTWYEVGVVRNSLGHHSGTDRFFVDCEEGESSFIGYYRHYTIEDLVDKANDMIGDSVLPDFRRTQLDI